MAAFHYAAAAPPALRHLCRRLSSEALHSRNCNLVISCASASFRSRTTRRKNYLREKILKTLKHPDIPKPSVIVVDSPSLEEVNESGAIQEVLASDKCEDSEAGNEVLEKFEELGEAEVSVPAGNGVNLIALDKNSILKFALWLIGAFVFQTVCAVWVFSSSGMGNEESSVIEVGEDGKDKSRIRAVLIGNGNGRMGLENSAVDSIVYVDELEMERKIEEIRGMARAVREKERLESHKNGYDSENSEEEADGDKYAKSGIEEEVDDRLIKLRKKLENTREKMPVPSVGYSVKDSARKGEVKKSELDEGEGNGALLFQKKYKFRGLSMDPLEKPKGFTGSGDYRVNNFEESGGMRKADELFQSGSGDNGAVGLGDGEKLQEVSDIHSKGNDGIHVVEESREEEALRMNESTKNARPNVVKEREMGKQGKGKGTSKPKVVDGGASEKNSAKSIPGEVKSRKVNTKVRKSRKSNDLDIAVASNKLSEGKNGSEDKGVGDSKLTVESKTETDDWWLNLPYVLVIIMRRGNNGEGGEGFYTLKHMSSSDDRTSHIIAFEDRADATNFCYLLLSFFEDLEDFRADVVPLTAKELNEAVKSRTMRATVVKRGQLRLYAGQPLGDAEMALRALVEQG